MKIVAILASFNEEYFIRASIENYIKQGVEVFLMDNESTDKTVDIAREYLGRGVIRIETIKRYGTFRLFEQLKRKEAITDEIEADWYIHADPDEIRLPPRSDQTLCQALEEVDRQGYNAVNFMEFTFVPTHENPDHEGQDFQKTMRWYYPYAPDYPNQVKAWKRQVRRVHVRAGIRAALRSGNVKMFYPHSVDLASTGGHRVQFEGLKLYPHDFKMRHYIILSLDHAVRKYVMKNFSPDEIKKGWHNWRRTAKKHSFKLPSQRDLKFYTNDDELDASNPYREHLIVHKES